VRTRVLAVHRAGGCALRGRSSDGGGWQRVRRRRWRRRRRRHGHGASVRHAALSAAGRYQGRDHHAEIPRPVPGAHRVRVGDPSGRRRRRLHDRGVLHAAVRHRRADNHRVLAVSRRLWLRHRARGVQQVAHHAVRPVDAVHVTVPGHPVPA